MGGGRDDVVRSRSARGCGMVRIAGVVLGLAACMVVKAQHGGHGGHGSGGCGNPHVAMALLDLLPPGQETVMAIGNGAWSSPATWGGTPPGPGDDVLIPAGVTVTYDVMDDGDGVGTDTTRVHTVRVDGTLRWATDRSTRLFIDTLFSSPEGVIEIGTDADPILRPHEAEIVIIADDPMDPAFDTGQLGRGFVPHGRVRVVGQDKTDFAKLAGDALAGETTLTLREAPQGWRVGDKLVLGGTFYNPEGSDADNSRFHDEVLTVTGVVGNVVSFTNDAPGFAGLRWDHVRPSGTHFDADDLNVYVANLTRNVTFRSELDPASPEVTGGRLVPGNTVDVRRGHVMVMHTPDAVFRNSAYVDFGRLNKDAFIDDPGTNVDGTPGTGVNKRGRYVFHLHRNLLQNDQPIDVENCPPTEVTGNVAWGGPGWGFVHHDSHAVFEDNVAFDILGSAFVQEAGNEIGRWRNNISIKCTGDSDPRMTVEPFGDGLKRVSNFDFGFNGEAYWIQGASQVEFIDNVAVSAAGGGVNIFSDVDANSNRDRAVVPREHLPPERRSIITSGDSITVNRVPANTFDGLEVCNSDFGLITWNHMRNQGAGIGFICPCDGNVHRQTAVIRNFRLWNIYGQGVHLQYSSQIEFLNGVIASNDLATPGVDDKPEVDLGINGEGRGYGFGMNGPTKRLVLDDVAVEGWAFGVRTPLEGQLNDLDTGEGVGSEGAMGLPLRRSIFRDLRLANNDDNFYRRQNGFSVSQPAPNFLVIDGGVFEIPAENQPPVADFAWESLGGLGVVRLSGLPSRDFDTPGEGLYSGNPSSAFVNDDNYIVSYAWDFDGDNEPDAHGEVITTRFPLNADTPVTLTVWDHQGATASVTIPVRPEPVAYEELVVDGSFDAGFRGGIYSLSSSGASTGWWSARANIDNGRALLTGEFLFSSVAQAVYDDFARRGTQRLSFDLEIFEGGSSTNRLTVGVYGVNGEFGSAHADASPEPAGAVPVEITTLYSEAFSSPTAGETVERDIDFGPDGFQYVYIGFAGDGVSDQIPGDFIRLDNVSLVGPVVGCLADFNGDGDLGFGDVLAFLEAIENGDPMAELDGEPGIGFFDLLVFLTAFAEGCD